MKDALINRLRSWGNKSIGLILFVVCLVAIYNKVAHNENLNQYSADIKIQFEKVTFLEWAVLLLLFLVFQLHREYWQLQKLVCIPSNSNTKRSTPCAAGCWGPKFSV